MLSLPNGVEFLQNFIMSQSYADEPHSFFYALKGYVGLLTPYSELILTVCEVFARAFHEASRDISTRIAAATEKIPPLLLRLYEQAQGQGEKDIANRCLDAWDLLFENRVGRTRELTRAIEQ